MSSMVSRFSVAGLPNSGTEWFHRLCAVFASLVSKRSKIQWVSKVDNEVVVYNTPVWIFIRDTLMCLLGRLGIVIQVVINCLAVAACGMTMGFPAVALPALASSGHNFTANQVSMVGCACYLMILIGSYTGGILSEKSGRRKTLLTAVTPSIVGWVVASVSDSMIALVSGLLFLGIGMGLSNSCTGVYLTELVSAKKRRFVTAAQGIAFSVGLTLVYVLGFIIRKDWRRIALISSAIPTSALLLGLVFLRESRVWLMQPKRTVADKYFCGIHRSFWSSLVHRVDVYRFFYPFNAVLILFQLSGSTVLITFAVSVLDNLKLSANVDPYILAISLGLSHMVGPVLAELFTSGCGPRRTMVYSATFMSLSILFLARLHKISGVRIEDWPPYTAEAFVSLFICASSIFTSVAGSQQEKIFPTDVRRACSSMTTFNSWIGSCVAVVTYPAMANCLSLNNIFMVYASCCVSCAVLTIMLLPEVIKQPVTIQDIGDDPLQLQLVSPPPSKTIHRNVPPIIAMGPDLDRQISSTTNQDKTKPSKKKQLLRGFQSSKLTESQTQLEPSVSQTKETPAAVSPQTTKEIASDHAVKKLTVQQKQLPEPMTVPVSSQNLTESGALPRNTDKDKT